MAWDSTMRIVEDKTYKYQLKPAIEYIIETYNVIPEYILADWILWFRSNRICIFTGYNTNNP